METTTWNQDYIERKKAWKKFWKENAAKGSADIAHNCKLPLVQEGKEFSAFMVFASIVLAFAIILISGCFTSTPVHAAEIDMQKISQIESSGCKEKFGRYEHARGCWQITQPVLDEWNSQYKNSKYSLVEMLDNSKCFRVANWYMNVRIPAMLKAYKKPVTVKNQIIAWNAGISYVAKNKRLPKTTVNYLKKYGA